MLDNIYVIKCVQFGDEELEVYVVELYMTESGRAPVQEYIRKLAKEGKEKEINQIIGYEKRLEEMGMAVNNKYPETIRPIRNGVYELHPGGNRVFFFYFEDNRFVLLHAYKKHSQKAPKNEIEKAINEMNDHKRRKSNG